MKKKLSLLIAILCIFFFISCRNQTTNSTQNSDGNREQKNEQNTAKVADVVPAEFAGTLISKDLVLGSGNSSGYYSINVMGSYANIMYTDYKTQKQIVLCNRPECRHDNDSCTGYEGEDTNTPSLLAFQDKLVFIYPGNPYYYEERGKAALPRIDVSNLDGSNKKTVATFASDILTDLSNVAYDSENIYLMQEIIQEKDNQLSSSLQFQQVNLSTSEMKRLAEFSDSDEGTVYFLGAAENVFIFKRISNGEWDENVDDARDKWNKYVSTQMHEIFTLNSKGEFSDPIITYPQDRYSSYVFEGEIILIGQETTLVFVDPQTGTKEEIVRELPFAYTLLYGIPKVFLGDWLILDLVPQEDAEDIRYAVNSKTHEYKKLDLSTHYDGLTQPYVIYAVFDKDVLVRTDMHMEHYDATMPDGTVADSTRMVEDWALMKVSDFLQNKNIAKDIEKYSR